MYHSVYTWHMYNNPAIEMKCDSNALRRDAHAGYLCRTVIRVWTRLRKRASCIWGLRFVMCERKYIDDFFFFWYLVLGKENDSRRKIWHMWTYLLKTIMTSSLYVYLHDPMIITFGTLNEIDCSLERGHWGKVEFSLWLCILSILIVVYQVIVFVP